MGLFAWYPLNGTGESKGTVSNAFPIADSEYASGGKIGKYYATINKRKSTGTINNIEGLKQVSIAFWYKENLIDTVAWQDFIKFYVHYDDGTKVTNGEFRYEQHSAANKLHVYTDWYCNVTNTSYPTVTDAGKYTNSPELTDLKWHHTVLMLDFENNKCISYVDGILNKTSDINKNAKYINGAIYIGDSSIDGGICDLRIYDELISKQQIKDLYNCLVLHYPLSNDYGNENLLVGNCLVNNGSTSISYDRETNTWTSIAPAGTLNWGYGFYVKSASTSTIPYGEAYRFSAEVLVPTAHSIQIDTNNKPASGEAWGGNDNDNKLKRTAQSFSIPANTWTKIVWGSENSNSKNTEKIGIIPYDKIGLKTNIDEEPVTWYLRNIKLELGKTATPWCPNKADTLYKTLGYDSNVEYDISGFGNNGIRSGSGIGYSTNTALYNSSTSFTGNENKDKITIGDEKGGNRILSVGDTISEITLSCWVWAANDQTFIGAPNFISLGQNSFIRYRMQTSTSLWAYGMMNGQAKQWLYNCKKVNDGNWHNPVFTFKNGVGTLYLDGEKLGSTDYSSIATELTCKSTGWYIGEYQTGSESWIGNISDARIYMTALTADDIKTLYKTRGKIDKNGNVYCSEFIEDGSNSSLKKNGELHSEEYNEKIDGYERIEYISKEAETQRYCYIDLGLYPSEIDTVECDIQLDAEALNGSSYFFGGYYGGQEDDTHSSYYSHLYVEYSSRKIGFGYDGAWYATGFVWNLGDRHNIKSQLISGKQEISVDGKVILTQTSSRSQPEDTNTVPLMIYQYRNNRLHGYGWSGRIYSIKIKGTNGKILRNLIPVKRCEDEEVGLYDLKENIFYGNQDTRNSFSGGKDKLNVQLFNRAHNGERNNRNIIKK